MNWSLLTLKQLQIDSFEYPWFFLFLLIIPIYCIFVYRHPEYIFRYITIPALHNEFAISDAQGRCTGISIRGSIKYLYKSRRFWAAVISCLLVCTGYVFLTISAAHPFGGSSYEARSEGIDVYFVLDMSASMKAYDYSADEMRQRYEEDVPTNNRFDTAKETMLHFIDDRAARCEKTAVIARCDRIGVSLFAQSAFIDIPLTTNYALLREHLLRRQINDIDATQSAIGDGILRTVASLRHSSAKSKNIVIITDGDRKGGRIGLEQAAAAASEYGVRIFPILIGQSDRAVLMQKSESGYVSFHEASFPVRFELLESAAIQTGGRAYQAASASAFQDKLNEIADILEPSISNEMRHENQIDLSLTFAGLGLLLLFLSSGIYLTLVRQYP